MKFTLISMFVAHHSKGFCVELGQYSFFCLCVHVCVAHLSFCSIGQPNVGRLCRPW